VLNDLASSAYYAGGEAEQFIGKTAPWFILAIMLFSYAVRAIYVESCSMFVRGGVYRVVKEAMGGTLAKFSVSALMFDYVLDRPDQRRLRGPIPGGLPERAFEIRAPLHRSPVNATAAAAFAIIVTLYFWWENIKGDPGIQRESSAHHAVHHGDGGSADRLVLLHAWVRSGSHLPPLPIPRNISSTRLARLAKATAPLPHTIGIDHLSSAWATPCWR
jgi:hypothetical protein